VLPQPELGFNTGQSRRISPDRKHQAQTRINNIPPDPEFRNQQVGSIPAGGSTYSESKLGGSGSSDVIVMHQPAATMEEYFRIASPHIVPNSK
jgi:hypothetical protein